MIVNYVREINIYFRNKDELKAIKKEIEQKKVSTSDLHELQGKLEKLLKEEKEIQTEEDDLKAKERVSQYFIFE